MHTQDIGRKEYLHTNMAVGWLHGNQDRLSGEQDALNIGSLHQVIAITHIVNPLIRMALSLGEDDLFTKKLTPCTCIWDTGCVGRVGSVKDS